MREKDFGFMEIETVQHPLGKVFLVIIQTI